MVTHQHMDHLGLLEILSRRSGAEVATLDLLAPYLENSSDSASADDDFAALVMRRHGIPTELVTAFGAVGAAFRSFGSGAHVTRALRDGDQLELRDRRLQVPHRPGHSPSDTLLWDEDRQILFASDHLLAHISSNPLVSRPLTGDWDPADPRPHALITYIESMRATRELPAKLVLSGHGEPIVDHGSLIASGFGCIGTGPQDAADARQCPLTAYEIALQMWGNVAVTQAYLTLSEVLGHMDLLIADGRAREQESGEVIRFEALG